MELKIINNRYMDNNTYILIEDNKVIIIDPSCNDGRIENYIKDKQLLAVFLTHGHYDHLSDVNHLYNLYPNINYYCNSNDWDLAYGKLSISYEKPLYTVKENILSDIQQGVYQIGPFKVIAYHTPGHSKGEMMYQIDNMLFSGDMLFKESIGRCDFVGGSYNDMKKSIAFIKTLKPSLIVYPGHGQDSTIEHELMYNPYFI